MIKNVGLNKHIFGSYYDLGFAVTLRILFYVGRLSDFVFNGLFCCIYQSIVVPGINGRRISMIYEPKENKLESCKCRHLYFN